MKDGLLPRAGEKSGLASSAKNSDDPIVRFEEHPSLAAVRGKEGISRATILGS
jgi:hypothetical protein